jgi:hypothetical protein
VAATVAVAAAVMLPAVAVKFIVVEPAGTVTEAGTGSRALLLVRITVAPPLSAAPDSVTTQELDCPETRLVGLHAIFVNVGAGATN